MSVTLYLTPGAYPELTVRGYHVDLSPLQRAIVAVLASEPDRHWRLADLSTATGRTITTQVMSNALAKLRAKAGHLVVETSTLGAGYRLGQAVKLVGMLGEIERSKPEPHPTHGAARLALISRAPGAIPAEEAA